MQDLYAANYAKIMKNIRRDLNNWRATPCQWIEKLDVLHTSTLMTLVNVISIYANCSRP